MDAAARSEVSISRLGKHCVVCVFLFSVSSALGIAIQDRTSVTGGRETVQASYDDTRAEIEEIERKRKVCGSIDRREKSKPRLQRSSEPVSNAVRVRGTVGSLSGNCSKADTRTVESCAEVAALRQELAVAVEGARLDQRVADLRRRAQALRERGAGQASDPQAELLARLTHGWLSARDVGPSLALLLACVIELVSAFGPVVLSAYGEATSRRRQRQRGLTTLDYMLERIEPGRRAAQSVPISSMLTMSVGAPASACRRLPGRRSSLSSIDHASSTAWRRSRNSAIGTTASAL